MLSPEQYPKKRTECVVCRGEIQEFFVMKDFPMLTCPTTETSETDRFVDQDFYCCVDCKSVQLRTLLDPAILYNFDNKHSLTPLWKEHHNTFAKYVVKTLDNSTICEIGGGSNSIVNYIDFPHENYTIMDLYETEDKIPGVNYIIGNCESFTSYKPSDAIVMGHTFEHLYTPYLFMEALAKSPVNDVVLSVPNLRKWLLEKSTFNLLFNQHTFYFEGQDMKYLFAKYGFECVDMTEFKSHSVFAHFRRSATCVPVPLHVKDEIQSAIYGHFNLKAVSVAKLSLTKPVYVMPSYYFGQIVYFYSKNKPLIKGFLDNDKNKVNKRLYGTPLETFSPEIIQDEDVDVVLVKTPYFEEMNAQLKRLNPSAKIHTLEIV